MATSAGPVQNNGQITWWANDISVGQSTSSVTQNVDAYFLQVAPYYQQYNGSKSWSGAWGSGSAAQGYFLNAGQNVRVVTSSRVVTLTDATQSFSFTVTTNHYFGSTGSTWSRSVPARYARTPTALTVTRNSDTSHTLNWNRNSTYTSVIVQRGIGDGQFQQVGRPSGNAYTYTDTTTKPNSRYFYRVAGVGGSGQSPFSGVVGPIYTTPAAPQSASAERISNSEIVVTATGLPPYATAYDIEDNGEVIATNVSLPWSHMNPSLTQPHTYKVRGTIGALKGQFSPASNVVQLLSKPNPPTNLDPNGLTLTAGPTPLKWKHNPVDTTAQTAARVQYRAKGMTAWTTINVAGSTQGHTLQLAVGELEWRVATKGQHADFSEYSAVATIVGITEPGVAITSPPATWDQPTIPARWTFFQAEGKPQTTWQLELLDDTGAVLETRSGSGNTSGLTLNTRVQDSRGYVLRVRAASGNSWAQWAEQPFEVKFTPPAPAKLTCTWDERQGSMELTLLEGRGPSLPPVRNYFQNSRLAGDGTWVEVARNFHLSPEPSRGGWASGTNVSRTVVGGVARFTATQNLNAQVIGYPTARTQLVPGTEGVTLSGAVSVSNPGSRAVSVRCAFEFQGGPLNINGNAVTVGPGETVELSVSGAIPAGATTLVLTVRVATGGGMSEGDMIDVLDGAVLFSGVLTPFRFSGSGVVSAPMASDFRARYLGAVNASESVLEGERVRTTSVSGCIGIKSTLPDGQPAVRIISQGASGWFGLIANVPGTVTTGVISVYREDTSVPNVSVSLRTYASSNEQVALVRPADFPAPGKVQEYRAVNSIGAGGWIVLRPTTAIGTSVWYSGPGMFQDTYEGPVFTGSSGLIKFGDTWMETIWEGEQDSSTSLARTAPLASEVFIERSTDGGRSWYPLLERQQMPAVEGEELNITDWESLVCGVTLYRVTTIAPSEAASVTIFEGVATSAAAFLGGGGPSFNRTARLPNDPSLKVVGGRVRSTEEYAGRPYGVAYSSRNKSLSATAGGTVLRHAEGEATIGDLEDVFDLDYPLHVYRFEDRIIYGSLSLLDLKRAGQIRFRCGDGCGNGVYSYGFSIKGATRP